MNNGSNLPENAICAAETISHRQTLISMYSAKRNRGDFTSGNIILLSG
jgi:hypothetical protein